MSHHRSRVHFLAALGLVLALLAAGCGSSEPTRPDVLRQLATDTIVPTLKLLEQDTAALSEAVTDFCKSPGPTALERSHEALATVRATWALSEPMWVGPVMERRSWAVIDWPVDRDEIESLIDDSTVELDNERLSRRIGADQRGLGAVEYLLGNPREPDATIDALVDGRRCAYLTGIAAVAADEAALLPGDWTEAFEDGSPWIETFVSEEGAGIDRVVNDTLFLLEAIADAELGAALGEMDRQMSTDEIVEGGAGLGVADIGGHLTGLRAILVGRDSDSSKSSDGLSPLLGSDLTDRLTTAFDEADIVVGAIDGPLLPAVENQAAAVSELRATVKKIQILVTTEVVSRLGVTIGFSDADGDTGG